MHILNIYCLNPVSFENRDWYKTSIIWFYWEIQPKATRMRNKRASNQSELKVIKLQNSTNPQLG